MDFKTKKDEIIKKYETIIGLISETNHVDMGVAYDMFKANVTAGAKYKYFNEEEAKKDFEELISIAEGNM